MPKPRTAAKIVSMYTPAVQQQKLFNRIHESELQHFFDLYMFSDQQRSLFELIRKGENMSWISRTLNLIHSQTISEAKNLFRFIENFSDETRLFELTNAALLEQNIWSGFPYSRICQIENAHRVLRTFRVHSNSDRPYRIKDVIVLTDRDIKHIPNFRIKSIVTINEILAIRGLRLNMTDRQVSDFASGKHQNPEFRELVYVGYDYLMDHLRLVNK